MKGPWHHVVFVLALVLTSRAEPPAHARDEQRDEVRAQSVAAAVHASKRVDSAADARDQPRAAKLALPPHRFVAADPDRARVVVETARSAAGRDAASQIRHGARAPPRA